MKTAKVSMFLRRHAALWPIILMSVLLGIGFYFFPWVNDDINFRFPFRDHFLHGAPVRYSDIWAEIWHLINNFNSRLANMMMYHLEFLPKWLIAVIQCGFCGTSVWLGLRLINKQNNFVASMLLCALFAMFMPWIDHFYDFDFQLNYICGTVLSLWLCWLLLFRSTSCYIMMVVGILVGAWQECCGLPLMLGFITIAATHKQWRTKRTYAAVSGLFLGLFWLWISPGGQKYRTMMHSFFGGYYFTYVTLIPIFIYLIIYLKPILKHNLSDRDTLFLTICLTSTVIVVIYPAGPRVLWFGNMIAYIGIVDAIMRNGRKWVGYLSIALYLFMCLHLVIVDILCYKERIKYNYVAERIANTPISETIFAPLSNDKILPYFSLLKPLVNNFSNYGRSYDVNKFYTGERNAALMHCVVPEQLKNVNSYDGEEIPGGDGFRYVNGWIIGLPVADCPCNLIITVKYGELTLSRHFFHVPFITADGKRMAWYHNDRMYFTPLQYLRPSVLKFQ